MDTYIIVIWWTTQSHDFWRGPVTSSKARTKRLLLHLVVLAVPNLSIRNRPAKRTRVCLSFALSPKALDYSMLACVHICT